MTLEIASSISSKTEADSTANLSSSFSSVLSSDVSLSNVTCAQEPKSVEHNPVLPSEIPSENLTPAKSQEGEKQLDHQENAPDSPTESKNNSPLLSPTPSCPSSPASGKQNGSEASEHSEPLDPPAAVDTTLDDLTPAHTHDDEDQVVRDQHHEALDSLREIELEFAKLRDRIYRERLHELEDEIKMVENENHPELTPLLEEVERKRRAVIDMANAFRNAQLFTINNINIGTEYQIRCDFENARKSLKATLSEDTVSKKHRLKKEYERLDEEIYTEPVSRKIPRLHETNLTPAKLMMPDLHLVSSLDPAEISEDLALIQLATAQSKVSRLPFENSIIRVYAESGKLSYYGQWLKKGDAIMVNDFKSDKYNAKFLSANKEVITVQRPDGSKEHISLDMTRQGKYELQLKV
ncbi:hypothetical protein K493DRAFT_311424 [Basidiobolus meristosporus CBS 931.73]|uniref:Sds3-like-domain-containing protein n=1 Tax=Basidiobolus meristosporus CBS 931.73 TaxID=1314790 RepID=A0A1Y1Z2L1_9FUNG|nr:hypothetical protein K493DRAFT_311424 [Basidiobolus meristosporus CBS 931.73]|eukprot:ORY04344.1 hypothetical protein K493DRAFT_311424 [Basidiobolus meristosporus CBS 931.73]